MTSNYKKDLHGHYTAEGNTCSIMAEPSLKFPKRTLKSDEPKVAKTAQHLFAIVKKLFYSFTASLYMQLMKFLTFHQKICNKASRKNC